MIFKKAWLVCVLVMAACSPGPTRMATPEGMPDVGIPAAELNKDLRVVAPPGWNNGKTTGAILLVVNAIGQHLISFDQDDVRIFLYQSGTWTELANLQKVTYLSGSSIVILDPAQKDDATRGGFPHIKIDLPDPGKPALVRVFAIGYVYESGRKTETRVASFIDLKLTP